MSWTTDSWMRLRALLSRKQLERVIDEEIRFHIDERARDYQVNGLESDEARVTAERRFGDDRAIKRELYRMEETRIRTEQRVQYFEEFFQDIRYGIRQLLKKPAFTIIIIGTLALGIGANSAIFSVLKTVALEPLPYPDSDELTIIFHGQTSGECCGPLSGQDFLDFRETSATYEYLAGLSPEGANLSGGDEDAEMVIGGYITTGFFEMLGIRPAMGRTFLPEEAEVGNNKVVILSDELWRRRYNSDPQIVGDVITVNRETHTVVGIMPEGFDIASPWTVGRRHEIYWPLTMDQLQQYGRGGNFLLTYGRLRDGATLEQGSAELVNLAAGLAEQYPETNENKTTYTWLLRDRLVGGVGFQLIMLLGAAGFVLLIVCGNVASLLLAKATSRQTEMAIRAAVGASRGRVIRQLLTESLTLALVGGAAGFAITVWGVGILRASMPTDIPRVDQIGIDWWVLGFAATVSVLTGVVFGLAPALTASRANLTESLKDGKATVPAGSIRSPLRSGLVIAQFALALLLANGAALMLKSYSQARGTDLGFDPQNTLTMQVSLDGPQYEVEGGRQIFLRDAMERVSAIPGVRHVGFINQLPLEGGNNTHVWAEDDPERASLGGPLIERTRIVGDIHQALGIELLSGRFLTVNDTASTNPSAIINQEMADRLWPETDAVGKRFSFRSEPPQWITVAGVVSNVRQWGVYRPAISQMYVPFNLSPTNRMYLVVRSDIDPTALVAAVRREVSAVDREQPISDVRAMSEVMSGQFAGQRFSLILTGLFATVALVLVTAGIYGVMSFFVAQGTREIGIRIALGSGQQRVVNLVVKRGLALTVIGSALGIAGVFATMQITRNMLFGMSPIDIPILAGGTAFIIVVGVFGSLVPALRATRVNPVNALRME